MLIVRLTDDPDAMLPYHCASVTAADRRAVRGRGARWPSMVASTSILGPRPGYFVARGDESRRGSATSPTLSSQAASCSATAPVNAATIRQYTALPELTPRSAPPRSRLSRRQDDPSLPMKLATHEQQSQPLHGHGKIAAQPAARTSSYKGTHPSARLMYDYQASDSGHGGLRRCRLETN